jgi:hypothetical protein
MLKPGDAGAECVPIPLTANQFEFKALIHHFFDSAYYVDNSQVLAVDGIILGFHWA